jgi:hypothetical protein
VVVGSSFDACFESNCRHFIFKMTKGLPRSINHLCDNALLICKAEKLQKVNKKILKKAATALKSDLLFTPMSHDGRTTSFWKTNRLLAAFGSFIVIWMLLGIYGYQGGLGERAQYYLHGIYSSVLMKPATVQQPISENVANPVTPPVAIRQGDRDSAKLSDALVDNTSEIDRTGSTPLSSGTLLKENNQQALPKADGDLEKESISPVTETKMKSSKRQAPENKVQKSGSGAALPEIKQPLQTEASNSSGGNTSKVFMSPLSPVKDSQPVISASLLHKPKSVVVKKGDTVIGIASMFFPNNKVDGVKKILAANPQIDDVNRIYPGQKLVIPETGSY